MLAPSDWRHNYRGGCRWLDTWRAGVYYIICSAARGLLGTYIQTSWPEVYAECGYLALQKALAPNFVGNQEDILSFSLLLKFPFHTPYIVISDYY